MKRLLWLAPLGMMIACPVLAQPGGGPGEGRGPRNPERMQQMIERFDEDGDGQLSREERVEARKARTEARGNRDADAPRGPRAAARDRDRPRGPRAEARDGDAPKDADAKPGDRGNRNARGPRDGEMRRGGPADGRGPGRGGPAEARGRRGDGPPRDGQARRGGPAEGRRPGRGGPPEGFQRGNRPQGGASRPNTETMFARLDRNNDGSLSKEEFAAVQRILRRLNLSQGPGAGGPRGLGGPARGGDRPAGPRADRDNDDRPARPEARGGGRGPGGPRGQAGRGGDRARGERGRDFGRPQSDNEE